MGGFVTIDQYANTFQENQKTLDEMKSDARDKAAAIEEGGLDSGCVNI